MSFKKYSFNKYLDIYRKLFTKEKYKLVSIFPNAKIEHVGSTSIIGLGGKGIIDIAISVPKNKIQKAIKKLQDSNYVFFPSPDRKERHFFVKTIKYNKNERRIHIQLTHNNSTTWKSLIAVREYLRKNRQSAREYEQLKKKAVSYAKGDGKKYRAYKNKFLEKIEKQALKEYYR